MNQDSASIFEQYEWAIIRLATCRTIGEKSRPPILVFASLEFVHSDRPPPDSTPLNSAGLPPHLRSPGSSGLMVYFRRIAIKAADALQWYRSAASGALTIPVPDDPSDRGRFDGTALRSAILVDEPKWDQLAFPISDQSLFGSSDVIYPTPFIGPGALPARIHRLMSAADPDLEALRRDPHICAWLAPRVHFRVENYEELLGSVVLVAPDPQISKVSQYFTRDATDEEKLVTLVQPRTGQTFDDLQLTVFEERFGSISTFKQADVPVTGKVVTEPPDKIRASGYMVSHRKRGLIDFRPPTLFLRTIGLSMQTHSRSVRLQTRDSRKKGSEIRTHNISEFSSVSNSQIGDTNEPLDAHSRFWHAVGLRQTGSLARKSDQTWINDPESGRAFIRRLIGGAREQVFVADCFFDGEDLASYLHFIHRLDVRIKVLTSRAIFRSTYGRDIVLRQMQASISSFHDRGIINVDVRFMHNRDGEPLLHDRFLGVDGAVWFSGNSLNAIGQRESMIIKLPDPKTVITRLNEIFDDESDDFTNLAD